MSKLNTGKDFTDFKTSNENRPETILRARVLDFVKNELNPSHTLVFTKLLCIQAFVGTLTLLFCPQFDMSLTNNYDLFHFFHHKFGALACMSLCGFIFIGSGAIFAAYLLKVEEIYKIKQTNNLYYFAISGLSILTFLVLGADIYLDLAAMWFLGAVVGGILMLNINKSIRFNLSRMA
ncbi:hypothetical protein A9Q84_01320 [Halobacteriovorax marinus]|uniref:Uncharacterized protein n=1 Tax=Halobacteriovorax marinus TaxID=97084 RepID=A0A1Y5FC37_9BACT|nr:hypothetical protein A9Q84_01320 [Halobacteriovorax marinus]